MKIISFFAGAGGLDLGFKNAGFEVIWANEFDKEIWETFEYNHKNTFLDKRNITLISPNEVPQCDGIIGGPPCQSWSNAGALRGLNDKRGSVFLDFINILKSKQPKFFLAENVNGMLSKRHSEAFSHITNSFIDAGIGYNLTYKLVNASDYNVPQDRKRLFFVGIRKDLEFKFEFKKPQFPKINLNKAIFDLKDNAIAALDFNKTNNERCLINNHEYMTGSFSSIYMSRNRVRMWDEQSLTIQANGRHAPIHPKAPKMEFLEKDKWIFKPNQEHLYRRLSIRECARIQTFPDDFIFFYKNINSGYKMIGNAVPINLSTFLANSIKEQFELHSKIIKN